MQNILQKQAPQLRISHQSEMLLMRIELIKLRTELDEIKQQLNPNTVPRRSQKIVLLINGQHQFVDIKDIIYCAADGNYTNVYIQKKNLGQSEPLTERSLAQRQSHCFLISKSLKSVIELIASDDFIRCHQSYFVNKRHVISCTSTSALFLRMSNEQSIPVSRRNKKLVLSKL